MRKGAMQGLLAAVLFAAVVTVARAADDDDADAKTPPKTPPSGVAAWWNGMFGSPPKPPEKVEKKPDRPAKPHVLTTAESEMLRRREKEAYLRRLLVCDRLRTIAVQKNDAAMEEQINELENTIFEVCQQRLASLAQEGISDEPQDKQQASGAHGSYRSRKPVEDDQ
jgi:hypothetical protein